MSRKHKKVCTALNYVEHFLILACTINWCISISAFASLFGIPIGITTFAVGLKIYAIAAGIKTYKSINKKKKTKQCKIVLSRKSKFNKVSVLICKALINSNISHDDFFLLNNVLKEYGEMKEEIKNLKDLNNSLKIL